jgi:hypothetical protein
VRHCLDSESKHIRCFPLDVFLTSSMNGLFFEGFVIRLFCCSVIDGLGFAAAILLVVS